MSFGFKFGTPPGIPGEVRLVDCRKCKNPHFMPTLRDKTGLDQEVQQWCKRDVSFSRLMACVLSETKDNQKLAVGCLGGRHRSVAFAEMLAKRLHEKGHVVRVLHRELQTEKTLSP
jgi:UPF0042 nucleotide-binding protein